MRLSIKIIFDLLQLIKNENVKAVVSMNEDYELWLFSNNSEVCKTSHSMPVRESLSMSNHSFCGFLFHVFEWKSEQCSVINLD